MWLFLFIQKRRSMQIKAISLNSCGRGMRYTFFFLLETPFLGSRLELLRRFSISYVVSQVESCSKSVKTTRSYHKSVVLKRKRVDWHCYTDQQNEQPLENYNQRMRHLYFSLSCYKIVSVFKFYNSSFLACFLFFAQIRFLIKKRVE